MKKIAVLIFAFCLFSAVAWGACSGSSPTWTCGSWADAESLIEGASLQTGDTVTLSAGTYTASSTISIPDAKKIVFQGAGHTSTIINTNGTAIHLNHSGSRLTGMRFVYTTTPGYTIMSRGHDFRIDNCYFSNNANTSLVAIAVQCLYTTAGLQRPRGLIDSNTFVNGRVLVQGIETKGIISQIKMGEIWAAPLGLGTVQAVYVENNTFTRPDGINNKNCVDSNRAGEYVFRFNTVDSTYIEAHGLQDGLERATRKVEIYNNKLTKNGSQSVYYSMSILGGTGVIFNNTVSGFGLNGPAFQIYRDSTATTPGGLCNGTSDFDGNESGQSGWLCRDQIGAGVDSWEWTTENPYPPQSKVPMYLWGNSGNPTSLSSHIQANRDYYNYTAECAAGGACTAGVGVGTTLPTSCTTGVGFWKTNEGSWNTSGSGGQGVLYKCTSTNTWTSYYTPYAYPHPLRSGETIPEGDETPPVLSWTSPATTIDCTDASGTMNVVEQLSANEAATVKVDTSDTDYDSMSVTLSPTGSYSPSRTIARACGATYGPIYALGMDASGNKGTVPVSRTYTINALPVNPDPVVFMEGTRFGENSTATIQGVITDTYMNNGTPDTSSINSWTLAFYTDPDATVSNNSYLKVDLSSIPTNATSITAKLYLYLYGQGGDTTQEITAHKVLRAAVPAQVTWNSYATGSAWGTAGGLGAGDIAAYESMVEVGITEGWYAWDISTMAAAWIATPATNYGVLLTAEQTANTNLADTERYFRSSNYTDAAVRPIVIVDYTVPPEQNKTLKGSGTLTLTPGGSGTLTFTW